jgi:hypothetical protein
VPSGLLHTFPNAALLMLSFAYEVWCSVKQSSSKRMLLQILVQYRGANSRRSRLVVTGARVSVTQDFQRAPSTNPTIMTNARVAMGCSLTEVLTAELTLSATSWAAWLASDSGVES